MLAARPGHAGIRSAVDALAASGIGIALSSEQLSYGDAPGGREIELRADGSHVGRLAVAHAEADLADALAPLFALALHAAAQARAAALLDAVGDGVLLYRDRQIVSANAAARELLQLEELPASSAVFQPRTLEGAVYPETPEDDGSFHVRSLVGGSERVFSGTFAPVELPGGEAPGSVVLFHEVGEAQERELLTERFLERLVDALPTAVTICDPVSFRVLSANRAMLELVGYPEEDVVGVELPYPWWAEAPEKPVEEWAPQHKEHWQQLFRRSDGTLVPVAGITFVLHGAGGEPERAVMLITDLSERRRFEQQLVQTGKLASIGELAAGVAHEINNPLFAILGLVEFLLKDAVPGTKAHERLTLVQQTGLEIKDIVRALLDFARERSDEFAPVSLETVVRQTLDLVRRTSAKKAIEIVERYPEDELTVDGSANQLKQVVLNLVTNAQHAMPEGGTVALEIGRDDGWATLTVTDTGCGITPETLACIFDPFFTTKRDIGGTGLGLSVSLGIAQMHGGDLSAESEEGRGATFTLRLPVAP